MPIRYRCPICNTIHEAAEDAAGKHASCPSCGQRLRVPAAPPAADTATTTPTPKVPPTPVRVQVSAQIIEWPQKCACCCEESNTVLQVTHLHPTRMSEKEVCWEIPYCFACLAHVKKQEGAKVKEACCGTDPAVAYDGYHGTVHTFRFFNPDYAARFVTANESKVLGKPRDVKPRRRRPKKAKSFPPDEPLLEEIFSGGKIIDREPIRGYVDYAKTPEGVEFCLGADTLAELDEIVAWLGRKGIDPRPHGAPRPVERLRRTVPTGISREDALRFAVSFLVRHLRGGKPRREESR